MESFELASNFSHIIKLGKENQLTMFREAVPVCWVVFAKLTSFFWTNNNMKMGKHLRRQFYVMVVVWLENFLSYPEKCARLEKASTAKMLCDAIPFNYER
jgi:hypothetical protein